MFEYGLQIGGEHTYRDWGLICTKIEIADPERKTYYVEIPGRDGLLDLSESLTGDIQYGKREIKANLLRREPDFSRWHIMYSKIFDYCHGRQRKIILDSNLDYYYEGRTRVESTKDFKSPDCFTIILDADPYKYERFSSLEKWEWNSLSLVDGIIREYKELKVNGTYILLIPGRRKRVVPVFDCSAAFQLSYSGKTYSLPAGRSKILDLQLGEGEHYLTFTGNGIISVDYRGGRL